MINQARKLNALYRQFEGGTSTPLERLKQLASLKGFEVSPMLLDGRHDTQREAVVIMADTSHSKGGQIFYNPLRSPGRVAFSVAHELHIPSFRRPMEVLVFERCWTTKNRRRAN